MVALAGFTEKLGPLPVWGWGLIGAGVVGGAYLLMNQGGGASSGGSVNLDSSGYQTEGIQGGSASIPETTSFDNNLLWVSRATVPIATALTMSPLTVANALNKWLRGEAITSADQKIIDAAVRAYGMPPEGVDSTAGVTPNTATVPRSQLVALYNKARADRVSANAKAKAARIATEKQRVAAAKKLRAEQVRREKERRAAAVAANKAAQLKRQLEAERKKNQPKPKPKGK